MLLGIRGEVLRMVPGTGLAERSCVLAPFDGAMVTKRLGTVVHAKGATRSWPCGDVQECCRSTAHGKAPVLE